MPGILLAVALASYGVVRAHPALLPAGISGALLYHAGLLRFLCYFLAGTALYTNREPIVRSRRMLVVAVLLCVAAAAAHVLDFALPLFGGYAVIYAAYARIPWLARFGGGQDLSYGVYLYAWPVQQLLVQEFRDELNPWLLTGVTLVVTGILALLSWNLVEKPALRLKRAPAPTSDSEPLVVES
jgi:peptidoglycan/LPS O-acetylase OafA/YrhL